MTPPSSTELFDAYYYQHGCGPDPYTRSPKWLNFFGGVADRLVQDLAPRTALDAGCALGFVVEALRDRGVEAYGVDISAFAIAQVREDMRPYCWQGSVTAPFPQKYDLIVCIEVLEHLPKAEAEQAVVNLCQHAGRIVFSSSPEDYREATHFNVQPVEYWAEQFARQGFVRDVDYDATFITPWAACFVPQPPAVARLVRDYERRFWLNHKEAVELRALARELRGALAARDQVIATLHTEIAAAQQALTTVQADHAALQQAQTVTQQQVQQATQALAAMQAETQAIQQTSSWRLVQTLWRWSNRLAPVGSLQERGLRALVQRLRGPA